MSHRLHNLRMENEAAGYEMEALSPRFATMKARHENGTAPRAISVYQLFQTPPEVAAQLVALLELKPGARVLEPSAGLGRLLDALQPFAPGEVVAIDSAPECSGELFRQDRAGVKIMQRDFLTVTPDEVGFFDAVVMNPPFHMRSDIKHIQHARKFLKPGGVLAAICFNTEKRRLELQPEAEQWIELSADVFRMTGTKVATAIALFRGLTK